MSRRLAVVGAGPIGLETALAASDAGYDVRVYEAGRVGGALASFGDVPLFTPFSMNSTAVTRARLEAAGASLPSGDAFLTARELVSRYLDPIAALPELRGRIREGARVQAIARDDAARAAPAPAGDAPGRSRRPFLLSVGAPEGTRLETADVVVDAGGIVAQPLATGLGGLEAPGEAALGDRADRRLLPSLEETRVRYAGRRALLIGSGHSAATALTAFEALAREGTGPGCVFWVHRERGGGAPFEETPGDPLPARGALAREANRIASEAPWLTQRPGGAVLAYEPAKEGIHVLLRAPGGASETVEVDRVYALVGYRPDTDLFRELRVHLCYDTEGPMALASALQAARSADPARSGDCLSQTVHGAETLRTTEPGFYVLGAKSYGRSPGFLLRVGYDQVGELMELLVPEGFAVLPAPDSG